MHGRGAQLHALASHQEKFRGVAPAGNSSDAGNWQSDFWIGRYLLNHVKRDRFHRRTAISAVCGFAVNLRARNESIQINAGDGINCVDGGKSIGAAFFRGASNVSLICVVGSEFYNDWIFRYFFHPLGDHLEVFRDLSDGAAHAALAHSVRTAEI